MPPKFAPRPVFEEILEWSVIATLDLLLEYGDQGVLLVKRTIEPYRHTWAFPGLRMYKGEGIDDTLQRIASQEVGLKIQPEHKVLLGQYVGRFKTEHQRQDLSTCYLIRLKGEERIKLNKEHFSDFRIVKTLPPNTGAMYKYYFKIYQRGDHR